jgi:CBS domain containing-hemolysin-like protein
MARKGSKGAKALTAALSNVSPYIAGTQIGITLLSIAIGSFTEPFVTYLLHPLFLHVIPAVARIISLLLVTFLLVVIGELTPKYITLKYSEKVAMFTFPVLRILVILMAPLIWLAQNTASLLLRPFGISPTRSSSEALPKEELLMLVQTGGNEGTLDKTHAEMVTRALRLDVLSARDIMVHRLDIKWIDVGIDKVALKRRLNEIPYSRIPICHGDIDEMIGVAYMHDIFKTWEEPTFSLQTIARPIVAIPENLPMERIVQTMREQKTQMLIVMDEYGGTSGLVTLEDVVEEVFGELEDRLESERPVIETFPNGRISARADVRFDELVSRLKLPIDPEDNTDTLAQIFVEALDRVPKPGDSVETVLGLMRVENMARRRITRVSVQLKPNLIEPQEIN